MSTKSDQKIRALQREINQLSVTDRLLLIQEVASSVQEELKGREPISKDILQELRGIAKTDKAPPTDQEVEQFLEERRIAGFDNGYRHYK